MALSRERLDAQPIQQRIGATLSAWSLRDEKLYREVELGSFAKAITLINAIAPHAEALDHHPELFNVYDRIELWLTTHDAGGITEYDLALAAHIEAEIESLLGLDSPLQPRAIDKPE